MRCNKLSIPVRYIWKLCVFKLLVPCISHDIASTHAVSHGSFRNQSCFIQWPRHHSQRWKAAAVIGIESPEKSDSVLSRGGLLNTAPCLIRGGSYESWSFATKSGSPPPKSIGIVTISESNNFAEKSYQVNLKQTSPNEPRKKPLVLSIIIVG